jgi:hypothetical protein
MLGTTNAEVPVQATPETNTKDDTNEHILKNVIEEESSVCVQKFQNIRVA